ncbi:carbohydrate binding domain-containing protein [Paenibacillus sp. HJGM_3]|uniref:carbohydrate binding domain-containing protein n=1 Tax=Paenibacillus sp. HJGM_3 TaxID=3379816 RepID=UPI00385E1464
MAITLRKLPTFVLVLLLVVSTLSIRPQQAEALHVNPNLLQNAGFEQSTGGVPESWNAIGGWGGSAVTLSSQAARTGLAGVTVQSGSLTNPWVSQVIPVEAGSTYDFSAWFKTSGVQGKGVVIKVEFYKGTQPTSANWVSGVFGPYIREVTGDWQPYSLRLTAPEESVIAVVYLRLWGTGTVQFEDTSVRLANLTLTTDQIVYYTDQTQGNVRLSTRFTDHDYAGKTVAVRVSDAVYGTVVASVYGLPAQPELAIAFDPSVMTPNTAYEVEAILYGPDASVWEEESSLIYRWARPATLPSVGVIQSGGEPFFPVIAYHANVNQYDQLHQIGINTVQGPQTSSIADVRSAMDAAQASGLKVLFPLYYYANVTKDYEKMRMYVEEFKHHPALLGWMIIDEPSGNSVSVEQVTDAYTLVRTLDSIHPVYMVEGDPLQYGNYARVPDIFTVDAYPLPNYPITNVGDQVRDAKEAARGGRPVWSILQTFAYPPPSAWTYLPTITEVRNMSYQSLLAGATGLGYYAINDPGWSLPASELWPGLVAFKPELELIGQLALSAPISQFRAGGVEWAIWNSGSSNGELYVVALNETNQGKSVSIPMPVTGYEAELLYGDLPSSFSSPSAQLNVELGAYDTHIYRLTPFADIADQAAGRLLQDESLSTQPHWSNKTAQLIARTQEVADRLSGLVPNWNIVVSDVMDLIQQAQSLKAWVEEKPSHTLGGDREDMVDALQRYLDAIMPLAGSQIGIELETEPDGTVLLGDASEIHVTVTNRGANAITNAAVTIRFPDSFQLAPITEVVGSLIPGGTYSSTSSFIVPASVGEADYGVSGVVDFEYGDVNMAAKSMTSIRTMPLMTVELNPDSVLLSGPDQASFQVELTNRANHAITAELLPQVAPLLGVNIPGAVSVAAGGKVTVQGSVYLNSSTAIDGMYPLGIQVKVGSLTFYSPTLNVNMSRNLVKNPGFETAAGSGAAPADWNMSAGYWDTESVHAGLHSVRLSPSSTNGNNFVSSSVIPLVAGRSYTLSGWTKHESSAGQVLLGMRYANAAGATISYQWLTVPSSSSWMYRSLPLVVPAGTTQAYVQYRMNQTANAPAWLDDLTLVENVTP